MRSDTRSATIDAAPETVLGFVADPANLERLVAAVQDDVYRLALRMLWHPEDA